MQKDYKGPVEYSLEMAIESIERLLGQGYPISRRSIALLLLQDDAEMREAVQRKEPGNFKDIEKIVIETKARFVNPISYEVALERQNEIRDIVARVVRMEKEKITIRERISRLTMNPITGLPLLFIALYLGVYKFVGEFGAGTVVDFIESRIFEDRFNPFVSGLAARIIPWPAVLDLFVGEYGVLTLGLRYAIALILPIVTFFFLVFSIFEDTGYLPRLAMLIDRVFKKLGLSGRAVIPMVLGFGCDTMATIVTRTLPTKRERIIATMLLSLAVPCSAQLGVILALLEGRPFAMLVWAGVVWSVFIFVGYLSSKILPGERPSFYMELPPLRMPSLSNIIMKTYVRVKWYAREILPLFIVASVLIWVGRLTGLFDVLIRIMEKPVMLIGLPPEAAKIFLFGFFRRDYGAAGLYDLNKTGMLSGAQVAVSCIALTLFLPCIAQFLVSVKERGWKTGLGISGFTLIFSFSVAYIVNQILTRLGVAL